MKYKFTKTRKIAIALLLIIGYNTVEPSVAYALTSGPAQPEAKGFQPAGVSDMVDLQTGDFKYNVPLLDIDGYPINLNYASGVGMDDEASWVGLGWSLNTGAINRQVRGIPDDYSGDVIETDHWTKPKITVGGKATAKVETFGAIGVNGSFSVGIFSDNYTGIGAEVGVNAGISFGFANNGCMTAGLGAGITSNTQTGAEFSPYANLSIKETATTNITTSAGLSANLSYNSRSGLKSMSLGESFNVNAFSVPYGTILSYNTEPVSPTTQLPYYTTNESFSFDVGPAIIGGFPAFGGMGYKNVRQVANFANYKKAYGFLYAERGKDNLTAQMDFIREKDNPIIKGIPNIAIPIHTPDMWSYTSQTGSGQFRLFRGGSGVFFDAEADDQADTHSYGGDLGAFNLIHGGYTYFNQNTNNITSKWEEDNGYLAHGDFQPQVKTDPKQQHVYFRQLGEKNVEDEEVNPLVQNATPVEIATSGMTAQPTFQTPNGSVSAGVIAKKTSKRNNATQISYLTAGEAGLAHGALERQIEQYQFYTYNPNIPFTPPTNNKPLPIAYANRVDNVTHKTDHISEITIADGGGKRMVYGIPVYNTLQSETTFAVTPPNGLTDYSTPGQVGVPPDVTSPAHSVEGVDNYYNQEIKPAYASSFLLTAILSPDYVDKTGDGITDDDLGTAIKFNYSKLTYTTAGDNPTTYNYCWRAPYENATLNKGLLADPDDDKGSVVYGEKELWYASSIETKTKVVYFITEDRQDALGAQPGWNVGGKDITQKQKCLKEIRLYSKDDLTRPIKVVKFCYDYTLCPNIPNSADYNPATKTGSGKLTLKSIWFEYGNSDKGKNHKYTFTYNTDAVINGNSATAGYRYMATDRWGNYKDASENPGGLDNEHYPYSDQTPGPNINAGLWHLSKICLPTGGAINVTYEPGDYAYVQDKKAMVMTPIQALYGSTALNHASGISLDVGQTDYNAGNAAADPVAWFKNTFLNGSDYLYTKLYVNYNTAIDSKANGSMGDRWNDYVPCYAKVTGVGFYNGLVNLTFATISDGGVVKNPMIIAAWQRLKNEYPRYAYPGYDNRLQDANSSVMGAVAAIVDAAKNLSELLEPFYVKADNSGYCGTVSVGANGASFARIVKRDGKKLGGPARVSRVSITDNWNAMDTKGGTPVTYGQVYTYSTPGDDGVIPISSGVAAYEPAIGNDENPLRQPVEYTQTVAGGISNYFDLEEPFCESLFPAPQIIYSKVTVHDIDHTGSASTNTGWTVNEAYTAKDFPVKVTVLPIINYPYEPTTHYTLTNTNSIDELSLSQGYSIELNDMHGKPKATRVFNQGGAEISSTVYYYNSVDNGGSMSLNNQVNVIDQTGHQAQRYLGREIELFTDFREQKSDNQGQTINIGGDIFLDPFPFGIPHFPTDDNNEYKLFRSACALKVIQNYGLISKVVKTENGSSITTENLAFDAVTGDPIVTRTQNEFNKNIYTLNMPAYWAYGNMGGAYQTSGVVISDLATDDNGGIKTSFSGTNYSSFFTTGDELLDMANGQRYWVVAPYYYSDITGENNVNDDNRFGPLHNARAFEGEVAPTNSTCNGCNVNHKKFVNNDYYILVDRNGAVVPNLNDPNTNLIGATHTIKVVRSGFRNMLNAQTMSIVSLNNPIVNGQLQITSASDITQLKAINASASTYNELWAMKPICNTNHTTENTTTVTNADGSSDFIFIPATANVLHAQQGVVIFNTLGAGSVNTPFNNSYIQARMDIAGTWMGNSGSASTLGLQIGFETDINIPVDGTYTIGYSGDDTFNYVIDGQYILPQPIAGASNSQWYMCPMGLTQGKHHLLATATNTPEANNSPANNPGTISLEIYTNSLDQFLNHSNQITSPSFFSPYISPGVGNVVFSTKDIPALSSASTAAYPAVQSSLVLSNGVIDNRFNIKYCINPYIDGFLGNWRPSKNMVYQQSRTYPGTILSTPSQGINLENAGYINSFISYWAYTTGRWQPTNAARWVAANTVTLYDKYGQQLENKDALGRFSAANFAFNGELPSVVASNAMNREIYTNSFEDMLFNPGTVTQSCSIVDINELQAPYTLIHSELSHSGNYCLLLPQSTGININTNCYAPTSSPLDLLTRDPLGEYNVQRDNLSQKDVVGIYPNGFEPLSGNSQPDLFDVWVNDGNSPANNNVSIQLSVNNTQIALTCKAVVEGWKLIEGKIDPSLLAAGALNIHITPIGSGNVFIDDLRIHPFSSEVKTYVYDDKTLRLMAELDENCFATFYEYDDEGLLVRVKKETEKGVMTLKESRSSYKKGH